MKVAARIRPRRSLTGPPRPPELPALAAAVEAGAVGEDHIREVCNGLDRLPRDVSPADRDTAEQILVGHATTQDAVFVATVGRKIAETLNPDGVFDDRDRQNRRGLTLGPQGVDGLSKLSGYVTPTARAAFEAVAAAVRPGHHLPGSDQTVVDARTDTRSPNRSACTTRSSGGWAPRMASGRLGTHRGLPVTVIATTTLADLEAAAAAVADPGLPMPAPARTGGGSVLPMRDLITLAAGRIHYLAVFENHSARPLYLGRSRRLASPDQRIICHARDHGCTHPNCAEPGYHCEVNHAVDYATGGPTDADNLFFACGPSNRAAADGTYTTHITDDGRLAWTDGTGPPEINRLHHPEELLRDHRRAHPTTTRESAGALAVVDPIDRTVDRGGVVAGEERDRLGDVGGVHHPARRGDAHDQVPVGVLGRGELRRLRRSSMPPGQMALTRSVLGCTRSPARGSARSVRAWPRSSRPSRPRLRRRRSTRR